MKPIDDSESHKGHGLMKSCLLTSCKGDGDDVFTGDMTLRRDI